MQFLQLKSFVLLVIGFKAAVAVDDDTVDFDFFVYSHAPQDLVSAARAVGEHERQLFQTEMAEGRIAGNTRSLDYEMELYSEHLLACSKVSEKLTRQLEQSVGDESDAIQDNDPSRAILKIVGFDDVTTRIFALPTDEIKNVIKTACLKHELHYQCANGFLNDPDKIRRNIKRIKTIDGNVKVMLEKECTNEGETSLSRIYSCLGGSADEIHASCSASMSVFNKTKNRLDNKILLVYRHTVEQVALLNENLNTSPEVDKENAAKIDMTMNEIRRLEAFKCKLYAELEKCAVNTMVDLCGDETREIVTILLRVGRLRRERGDAINDHFEELNLSEHHHCSQYV